MPMMKTETDELTSYDSIVMATMRRKMKKTNVSAFDRYFSLGFLFGSHGARNLLSKIRAPVMKINRKRSPIKEP